MVPLETRSGKIITPAFVRQKFAYCGPAALAMLLNFKGLAVSQDEIGDSIGCVEYFGCSLNDMTRYLRSRGLDGNVTENNGFEELKGSIDRGEPLIVLQWLTAKKQTAHYRIVVGYEEGKKRKVIVHDPELGEYLDIRYEIFAYLWSDFKNVCLTVRQ